MIVWREDQAPSRWQVLDVSTGRSLSLTSEDLDYENQ
jgi:hypothetical protein